MNNVILPILCQKNEQCPFLLKDQDGTARIINVIESFSSEDLRVIFCVNRKVFEEFKLEFYFNQWAKELKFSFKYLIADDLIRGKASIYALAKKYVDQNSPLFIYDAEKHLDNLDVLAFESAVKNKNCDAALLVDLEATEKDCLVEVKNDYLKNIKAENGGHSNVGLYWWRSAEFFFESVEGMMQNQDTVNKEFIVLPSFNYMLLDGAKILTVLLKK